MSRIVEGPEPNFDLDYAYGHQGELLVERSIELLKAGRVEVKRKRLKDDRFYIEYSCFRQGQWQPSGIAVSTAELWAFVIGSTGILVIVPAEKLKRLWLNKANYHQVEGPRGSYPTKGLLVSLNMLLAVATARVMNQGLQTAKK